MMRMSGWTFLCFSLLLTSCASAYEPIIDMKGVDQAAYRIDLEECRAYGEKVDVPGTIATDTLIGAGAGAAAGTALGASMGDYAAAGAKMGVAAGGSTGAAYGTKNSLKLQKKVIRKCMRGRGYKVLE